MEYYRGDTIGWSEVEASHDQLDGGARGIWAGGNTPTRVNVIQYITISTLGNTTDFGDLNEVKEGGASCSSRTKAVFAGGYNGPSRTSNSSYIIMSSTGNGVDYNDLSNSISGGAGFGSQTRGIIAGGWLYPTLYNIIDYVEIATTGNAVDFGDTTHGDSTNGLVVNASGVSNAHGGL